MTMADQLTFTKLFAQRSGASFATVLDECFNTEDFIRVSNTINHTNLALDDSGKVVVLNPKADFKREISLFADLVWREVFLQIQTRKRLRRWT